MDELRRDYESYLRHQRGLSDRTIYHCMRFLERFMRFRFGDGGIDPEMIAPDDIATFLAQVKSDGRPYLDKTRSTHLRSLFRFLFWSGRTRRDLADCVPKVRLPAANPLPRSLSPEDVERILDAVREDSALGPRNYAMLLVMARLGLRAPEVIAIELDDIDWRAGEIQIRGKGKLHDRMPLPADVGEAFVAYIQNGRQGDSRTLFVTARPPYRSFKNSQVLNDLLRKAFGQTGLKPPRKYVGSHVLRHSLAMDMLRNGASPDEIGDVLRHRSRATTMIYARHDVDGLRTIARPWPEAEDGR
jgi:site-specific recombinase XerD